MWSLLFQNYNFRIKNLRLHRNSGKYAVKKKYQKLTNFTRVSSLTQQSSGFKATQFNVVFS